MSKRQYQITFSLRLDEETPEKALQEALSHLPKSMLNYFCIVQDADNQYPFKRDSDGSWYLSYWPPYE